uniref:Gpm9 n=1 Tax=Arundo donax TaxID=35708 RepID=A0A0A9DUJ0_ARUDO
MKKHSNLQYI